MSHLLQDSFRRLPHNGTISPTPSANVPQRDGAGWRPRRLGYRTCGQDSAAAGGQAQGSPATSSFRGPSATRTGRFLVHGELDGVPSGVTGLETGGFTSDPHCQQSLAVEVKSSPGLGLSETEPSSRRTLASWFLSCQSVC